MRLLLVCLAVAALSCRGPVTRQVDDPPPPPPPECGDGLIQEGEDCDASDPGTGTCQSLGFDTGRLLCNAGTCRYDTSLCVKRCGNGVLDLGEACDGALGVPVCGTWGFSACSDTCAVDQRRCVAQAFEAGPELALSKGGRAVLGDLAPRGPGDLLMAVPSFGRVELFPWSMTQGFEAATSRKLSFLRTPEHVELIEANGDQQTDVATINADGTIDLIVWGGASFSLAPTDAGCPGARFVPSDGVARADVVVQGCGGFGVVGASGATITAAPALSALTRGPDGVVWADDGPAVHEADGGVAPLPFAVTALGAADLDLDGDTDLVTLTAAGVEVFEFSGVGYASRLTLTASGATELRAVDLDGDGQVDLLWSQGDELVVRRNRGGFVFTEQRVSAGAGTRRSVAVGDADGDQDLDLAVTIGTGPDSTITRVFLNRVR